MTEMNFGARLGQLREAFAESQQHMIEARQRLGALSAKAESRDGSIVVVLDSAGQIGQLTFRGDFYRDLDGPELSRRILAVVAEAQGQLRRSVAELMPRMPWSDLSAEEMLDPKTDITKMLPDDLFEFGGSVKGQPKTQKKRGRNG